MTGWVIETTLVTAALALVAFLLSRLRSIGPAVHHAMWLVVLIKLFTPPLIAWPWASHQSLFDWPVGWSQGTPVRSSADHIKSEFTRSSRWRTESMSISAISPDTTPAQITGV